MSRARYEALLLDIDRTLVDSSERIAASARECVADLLERGVRVMLVTGRSEMGVAPVVAELGLDAPVVVYNGAAVWCPREKRLIEEQVLSDRSAGRILAHARLGGHQTILQRAGERLASPPADERTRSRLALLPHIEILESWDMPLERVIRMTLFSTVHASSEEFCRECEREIGQPLHVTHFPIHPLLGGGAALAVADIHPPSRGKAEALRIVEESWGIPAERVVAVGDAANDVPMLAAAGLGVAMGNASEEVRSAADRVIGNCGTDAIADLVAELF